MLIGCSKQTSQMMCRILMITHTAPLHFNDVTEIEIVTASFDLIEITENDIIPQTTFKFFHQLVVTLSYLIHQIIICTIN